MRTLMPYPLALSLIVPVGNVIATDWARELARGTDIVAEWKADQHLFVKGEVGVPRERLAELERWLDANAPNWTVLLAENAEGETFADPRGGSLQGMEAVEYAIGRGLPRATGFADLVDPRTDERNGAAMAIFLKERAFSYAGSESQNRRLLGKAQWEGNLDRPAFRAMSNGGRLVDAVKDTVKEIDARLTQQLVLEQSARERAIVEAKQQRENAGLTLRDARAELGKLPAEVEAFASRLPGGDGDLVRPDLAAMREELEAGEARLADGDGAAAARAGTAVADWVRGQRQAMAAHAEAAAQFDTLGARIAEVTPVGAPRQWGEQRLAQAGEELGKARTAHARGDSSYAGFLANARQAVDSAEEEIARAKSEREFRAGLEREEVRRAEVRARRLRVAGLAAGGVALALFGGLGVLLNRRRRPVKAEAEGLLASWEAGAHGKQEGLLALLDRTTVVVGSASGLLERGYTGETLRLSEETIADVDELFIMSSAVERVVREARGLVNPGLGARSVVNLVSSGNYHKAMRLLRDEPITFAPDEGLEPILRGGAAEAPSLLGKLEDYKPFALSFTELIAAYETRAGRAAESLDRIENAWSAIHRELEAAGGALQGAVARAGAVVARSGEDARFSVPALAGNWLKSARDDLDAAVTMAAGDPVKALAEPLSQARRKTTEALALCEAVERARGVSLPAIRQHSMSLAEAGLATGWVGNALAALSDEANRICLDGVSMAVAERVSSFAEAAEALAARAARAVSLGVRMREKAARELEVLGEAIEGARLEIGKLLALPPERMLREAGADPDERLAEGWRQHAAAMAALNRGVVAETEEALGAASRLVGEAKLLIADSRKSLFEHAGIASDRRARKEALEHVAARNAEILGELREDYGADALLADATEKAPGTAAASIEKHVDRAEAGMARSWALTDRADAAFRAAKLLEAAALLRDADAELAQCDGLLGAISAQRERITKMEEANALKIEQVEREAAGLESAVADARVMRPTIDEYSRHARDLEQVRATLSASRRDPFALGRELARIDLALDGVARAVEEDTRWFEETQRSLREASAALDTAHQLSHRAETDDIPESRRMLEMQEEVERLRLREREIDERTKAAHGDWRATDVEADQITAAASGLVGEMRGELERAQAAVSALSAARAAVRDANGWSGGYGVRISGAPGSDLLHAAADLLQRGAYLECHRRADDAARGARQAVAEAKALVERHRAAEQREEDERRRQAEQWSVASHSNASSASDFGGGDSSGSGMSRSDFSGGAPSGSGMGRSGW